jgi:hypothetical protein
MDQLLDELLEAEQSEEEERVVRWRFEQFLALGFDFVDAALMADSRADLGQARRLAAAGCPADTAARILL